MKASVHPKYFEEANVVCVCGNKFHVGSTKELIHVELCYDCHPFYTGEQRFTDTRSAIKRFEDARAKAANYQVTKQKKVAEQKKKQDSPKSLREMLMGLK
jgi:large subunit ribosomal protein L31